MNLEKLVAAFVANAVASGFDSATVASALVRGAAHMAHLKSMTREKFMEAAGRAFEAVAGPTSEQKVAAIQKVAVPPRRPRSHWECPDCGLDWDDGAGR